MTNYERIKNMSIEEMAGEISCHGADSCLPEKSCRECCLEFLKKEAEENEPATEISGQ